MDVIVAAISSLFIYLFSGGKGALDDVAGLARRATVMRDIKAGMQNLRAQMNPTRTGPSLWPPRRRWSRMFFLYLGTGPSIDRESAHSLCRLACIESPPMYVCVCIPWILHSRWSLDQACCWLALLGIAHKIIQATNCQPLMFHVSNFYFFLFWHVRLAHRAIRLIILPPLANRFEYYGRERNVVSG